jgi:molecular chaperone DnaK (HSP70)
MTEQSKQNIIDDFFSDAQVPQHEEKKINYIIGIDFGTCNSCVGVWRANTFEVIPDENGNRTIPSVVAFTNKHTYVGYEAKNQILINPKNTIYEIKRLMGKKISDTTVASDKQFISYEVCPDDQDNVNVLCIRGGKQVIITPEVIASFILMKLKSMASNYLKTDITRAVITVPAYFNDAQRQATRDAATIAGLHCVRILNEPIASALAYGLLKLSNNNNTNVIVYDLGGGTLDIALLTICDGLFEVIQTAGNTHLGGVDFDNRLVNYCISLFKYHHPAFDESHLSADIKQKLYKSCENAKKILSTSVQTTIGVVGFFNNIDLVVNMTRDKFNDICGDLLLFCLKPLDDLLTSCQMKKEEINEIILVGGMTRVVAIRENIHKFFGKVPNGSINPDEIVANGAAIQGYMLMSGQTDPFSESITLLDMTPLSLGVETIGGIMSVMIPRNSPIPISVKRVYSNDTSGETSVVIKVFEGERSMTKDNFFVGEFELTGLTQAPIGFHKIEVTFTIDINGMITVTAEDLRQNNKTSICVTGHCGRLTQEMIQKMLIEAQEYEQYDKIRQRKKKLHYELTELCDNITKNMEFRENKMEKDEQEHIFSDIEIVRKTLALPFEDTSIEDYEKEIKRLSTTYTVLTLKIGNNQYNFKDMVCETQCTSVYQTDDDDGQLHVQLIANELGCVEDNSNYINELKQLRDTLVSMCNDTLDILNSPCALLDKESSTVIKDYIEDLLVWIHVQQKLTIDECQEKIKELTEMSNECISSLHIDIDHMNAKNELTLLCTTLKNSIESDSLGLNEELVEKITICIDDTLEWINIDVNNERTQQDYIDKITHVNTVCNQLYDDMMKKNEN